MKVSDALGAMRSIVENSWLNLKTGIGSKKDKSTYSRPVIDTLSYAECVQLYAASDLLARIVDEPAQEAFKKGYRFAIADADGEDTEASAAAHQWAQDHEIETKLCEQLRWSRQFGGGALFVGANDGQIAELPIDENRIRSIDFLTTFDTREAIPVAWYDSPRHPKHGKPSYYRINPIVFTGERSTLADPNANGETNRDLDRWLLVHESRVVPMFGKRASRFFHAGSFGWGESILSSIWQIVANYDTAISGSGTLLSEFSVPVFKVKGLAALMAADKGDKLKQRIELINLARSVINGIMVDADGEDFERKATSLSGLDGVLVQLGFRLAAASRFPMTRLFGMSPGGMNSTGEADEAFWFGGITQLQADQVLPAYKQVMRLAFLAKDGPTGGVLPDKWTIEPMPLAETSAQEDATTHLTQAQADQIYIDRGVLNPDEVRGSRFGGPKYSTATQIDESAKFSEQDQETLDAEGVQRIDPKTGDPVQVPSGQGTPAQQATPGATGDLQKSALNGAQVTSLVEVVKASVNKEIPREAAQAIIELAFQLTPEDAARALGPVNFEPEKPAQSAPAFGAQPAAPAEKPAAPAQSETPKPPEGA